MSNVYSSYGQQHPSSNKEGGQQEIFANKIIPQETQNRMAQIKSEFKQFDSDGNEQLTFEEVSKFLDEKLKEQFDRQLIQLLFRRMDRNHDQIVTIEEFAQAYVEAEEEIRKTIKELNENIVNYEKSKAETERKLQAQKLKEEMNSYNIMKGSRLTVSVIEAKDLIPMDVGGTSDPYCVLTCERQRIETQVKPKTLNPRWDENFTFEVSHGQESLKLLVFDKDTIGKDDFEGQIEIPLNLLKDQMRHESWFDLLGQNGERGRGKIHLVLQ